MDNFDWDSFVEESKKYKASACIWIDKENSRIELLLDHTALTYGEWIPGEGADISLKSVQYGFESHRSYFILLKGIYNEQKHSRIL